MQPPSFSLALLLALVSSLISAVAETVVPVSIPSDGTPVVLTKAGSYLGQVEGTAMVLCDVVVCGASGGNGIQNEGGEGSDSFFVLASRGGVGGCVEVMDLPILAGDASGTFVITVGGQGTSNRDGTVNAG
jgi:hypothetical protein